MASKKKAVVKKKSVAVAKPAHRESELLVTLDRVIAFLDHATTALNRMEAAVKGLAANSVVTPTPVTHSRSEERRVAVQTATVKEEEVAPVEHTASYNIVMKKLPLTADHEAVDLLAGQIKQSTKLTREEKVELLEACTARKNLIPF